MLNDDARAKGLATRRKNQAKRREQGHSTHSVNAGACASSQLRFTSKGSAVLVSLHFRQLSLPVLLLLAGQLLQRSHLYRGTSCTLGKSTLCLQALFRYYGVHTRDTVL